jgi:diguanylate cyclase (GGDEF)-like protein
VARSNRPFSTKPLDRSALLASGPIQAMKARYRPVLVVVQGKEVGHRMPLAKGILIGRDPDADLCLTDEGISWHHARVEDRGGAWALVDLESTNGTFVNGQACNERILEPGDKIALAHAVLRFEVSDAFDQAYDAVVERLLNIDDLSGLYVRRKFDEELGLLIQRASQASLPVGLLVMDLDGVKAINDANGHLFGAYVIGEAGRVIGETIDQVGFASRFGGDEFVAALRRADLAESELWAQRVLEAIVAHRFEHEGVELHPGISIGVASYPASATGARELFELADRALYEAKRAGKGCVRVWGP